MDYSIAKNKWMKKNAPRMALLQKEWGAKNPDRIRSIKQKWADSNKEKISRKNAEWRKNNAGKRKAYLANYKASKKRAMPSWADKFLIDEIYELAALRERCLGIEHHVDHVIPLQHPLVCGLHVQNNLQVITATENRKKHNTFFIS